MVLSRPVATMIAVTNNLINSELTVARYFESKQPAPNMTAESALAS